MITQTLSRAWTAFSRNKRYLILIVLLEFLFLYCVAMIHYSFLVPSMQTAIQVNEQLSNEASQLPGAQLLMLDSQLSSNVQFMASYHELLSYIGFFFVSMLAVFILFRTPLWYIAHKTIHKKMPLMPVLVKFPLLCVFWFIILFVILLLFALGGIMSLLAVILFVLLLYFAPISFALLPSQQTFKNTFAYGIRYAKIIVPAQLVNILIIFVALSLPLTLIIHPALTIALIVLASIALAFTRVHLIVATWLKHSR